ncbi:hypothetical protein OUY22_00320 [Nonomuraea sp. MCN248]|uniref:Uncharacterized protein n=1 Tax=Nonomuraea corallina TaxID=2989783 RepID=A0ABT4S3S5_9ACTN|nr:hypothetical protein [Nonomuraea corallina]MDA0631847.1 hypothetical protein [Nonomuraea corallina]
MESKVSPGLTDRGTRPSIRPVRSRGAATPAACTGAGGVARLDFDVSDGATEGDPIIGNDSFSPWEDRSRPPRRRVTEAAILSTRDQSRADLAQWTCPHGEHAGNGCVTCYYATADVDQALPLWDVAAWFTTERPIPIRALQDVHRHDRALMLTQPSTPLVYLLSAQVRAALAVEAVAGVVGFLVQNRHIVDAFTVTEIRAAHS